MPVATDIPAGFKVKSSDVPDGFNVESDIPQDFHAEQFDVPTGFHVESADTGFHPSTDQFRGSTSANISQLHPEQGAYGKQTGNYIPPAGERQPQEVGGLHQGPVANFVGGLQKGAMEFGASGAELISKGDKLLGGSGQSWEQQALHARSAAQQVPADPGVASTAGQIVSGAALNAPTMLVAPEAVPVAMGLSGAAEGAGSSYLNTAEQRETGQPISGLEEHAKAIGHAIIGYLSGHLSGKAFEGLHGLGNAPSRVAGQMGVAAGTGVGQQIGSNAVEGRPLMEGTTEAVVSNAVQMGIMGGVSEGVRAMRRSPPPQSAVPSARTAPESGMGQNVPGIATGEPKIGETNERQSVRAAGPVGEAQGPQEFQIRGPEQQGGVQQAPQPERLPQAVQGAGEAKKTVEPITAWAGQSGEAGPTGEDAVPQSPESKTRRAASGQPPSTESQLPQDARDSSGQLSQPARRTDTDSSPPILAEQAGGGKQARHFDIGVGAPEELASTRATAPDVSIPEKLEQWGHDKLKELGGTGLRGGIPFDPIKDSQRLAAYVAIGIGKAAKVARAAGEKFEAWKKSMREHFSDLTDGNLRHIWTTMLRVRKLPAEDQAAWYVGKATAPETGTVKGDVLRTTGLIPARRTIREIDALSASLKAQARTSVVAFREGKRTGIEQATTPKPETIGQRVRRTTGQTDVSGTVSEAASLQGSMKAQARAGAAGWSAAVEQGSGIRKEFQRLIQENLDPADRARISKQLPILNTLADFNRAVRSLRSEVIRGESLDALARLEKLTGKMKMELPEPPISRKPELNEAEQAEQLGKKKVAAIERMAGREIDLNKIHPDYRERFDKLIGEAKFSKKWFQNAKSDEDRLAAIDVFNQVHDKLYTLAQQHAVERVNTIGRDKVTVEQARDKIITSIGKGKQVGQPSTGSGEPERNQNVIRRWVGQRAATPQSLIQDIDGTWMPTGTAGEHGLTNVRRAQNLRQGEINRFTDARTKALTTAGYEPGTRAYNKFLNQTEPIQLPDAGTVKLTRAQQVKLYSFYSDPETQAMVNEHGGADFNVPQNRTVDPMTITPRDFEAIGKRLSPAERALKDDFFDSYNKQHLRDQSVKAKYDLSGYAPDTHEGYYLRRVNMDKIYASDPPTMRQAKKALENVSEMEPRASHRQPFLLTDFIDDTNKFIGDTAGLIHMSKPVRVVRMLLDHPETRSALTRRYGGKILPELDKFISNLTDTPDPITWDKGVTDALARNFYRANLTLNPRTMINNVLGGTQMLLPMFDAKDFAAGLKSMFSPAVHKRMTEASHIASARWNNPLYEQYGSFARDGLPEGRMGVGEALASVKDAAMSADVNGVFKGLGKAADSLTVMNVADSAPFRVAWGAAESEVNRLHSDWSSDKKLEYTLDRFHDATMRTQNGMTPTETSGIWSDARTSTLLKALTFLQNDSNKKLNVIMQARHADATTKGKVLLALAGNILTSTGTRVIAGGTGAALIYHILRGDPVEDKKKTAAIGAARTVVRELSGLIPGGNVVASAGDSALTGAQFRGVDIPVVQPVEDIGRGAQQLHGKNWSSGIYRITNALRTLAGDPTMPLTRDIVNLWTDVKTAPKDPRAVAAQEKTDAATTRRAGIAAKNPKVDAMLKRHSELMTKGINGLTRTAAENAEFRKLAPVADQYKKMNEAYKSGKTATGDELKRRLEEK